jgi:hypothetical protein
MLNSKKAVASRHNFCLERFCQEGATALRARKCNHFVLGFHLQKRRDIRAQSDGGVITERRRCLLLREAEKRVGILRQFAASSTDYRNPDLLEHTVENLVAQAMV